MNPVRSLLAILVLALPGTAVAEAEARAPLAVHPNARFEPLGPRIEYWVDDAGRADLVDVRSLPDEAWRASRRNQLVGLERSRPTWLRFSLTNPFPEPVERLVVLELPRDRGVDVHQPRGPGAHAVRRTDPALAMRQTDRHSPSLVYEAWIEPRTTQTWWIRLEPPVSHFAAGLWDEQAWVNGQRVRSSLLALLTGAMLAILGVSLAVTRWSRLEQSRGFLAFASGLLLQQVLMDGQHVLLAPRLMVLQGMLVPLQCLTIAALVSFGRSFLSLESHQPRLDTALRWSQYATLVAAVLTGVLQGFAFPIALAAGAPTLILLTVAVAMTAAVERQAAVLFLLGLLPMGFGLAASALTLLGVIDGLNTPDDFLVVTQPLSLVLFSVAAAATGVAKNRAQAEELQRSEEQLRRWAYTDHLTGVTNRAYFVERLSQRLRRLEQDNARRFGLLFLDLDRFKYVNDSFGHATGDEMLRKLAHRLTALVRPEDTIARFGGDEFMVLLDSVPDEAAATAEANRILAAINQPLHLRELELRPSASVGIALVDEPGLDTSALLSRVDLAMYAAKEGGKNRVRRYDARMHGSIRDRLALESELHGALERDELELFYQPIVAARDGRTVGFEALMRWQHAERGWISPGQFIPVAEETGLIEQLGTLALEKATAAVARWNTGNARPVFVTVNVSSRQIVGRRLSGQVRRCLALTGAQPSWVKLELTESALVQDFDLAFEELTRVAELGLGLCLDDFGTGYSSLTYLHQLPLSTIKIDRAFCSSVRTKKESRAIVRSVVTLARPLGLSVVAEGVEEGQDHEALAELGCDFMQGFHLGRPMPESDVPTHLSLPPSRVYRSGAVVLPLKLGDP